LPPRDGRRQSIFDLTGIAAASLLVTARLVRATYTGNDAAIGGPDNKPGHDGLAPTVAFPVIPGML
jgi:hypothetical protein